MLILNLILSGVVAAIIGGLVTYYSNKNLDSYSRIREIRKKLYTDISNHLSNFVSTVSEEESNSARKDLLRYEREVELWGSDEVVKNFKELLKSMSNQDADQKNRNHLYKNFVLSMRKDLVGKTKINIEDIEIRGITD